MKSKILTFIIGVLIGAIITTIGFYTYAKNISSHNKEMPQMMERPSDDWRGMQQGNPREMPSDKNI